MEKQQRIEAVDILRGIGIIIMIMGHIGFGDTFDLYIHAFHMPLFFFVSGYFVSEESVSSELYIVKKGRTLLIPYYAFASIFIVIKFILEYGKDVDWMEQFYRIFFYPTAGMPIAGALWFLMALFWSDVIFHFLHKLFYKNDWILWGASLIVGMIGMAVSSIRGIRFPWALDAAMTGVSFLGTAYFMKQKKETFMVRNLFRMKFPIFLLSAIVNGYLIFYNGMINMRKGEYSILPLTYLNAILAILLFWNIASWIENLKNIRGFGLGEKIVKEIGSNSLIFVCTNQVVIKMIKHRWIKVITEDTLLLFLINRVLTLLSVCFICYVCMVLIENSRLRILTGKSNR